LIVIWIFLMSLFSIIIIINIFISNNSLSTILDLLIFFYKSTFYFRLLYCIISDWMIKLSQDLLIIIFSRSLIFFHLLKYDFLILFYSFKFKFFYLFIILHALIFTYNDAFFIILYNRKLILVSLRSQQYWF